LRGALNVDWQRLVIVITRRTIFEKKSLLPVIIASLEALFDAMVTSGRDVVLEAIQDVRGVKIVNPMLIRGFPVVPGEVGPLVFDCKFNGFFGEFAISLVMSERVCPRQ